MDEQQLAEDVAAELRRTADHATCTGVRLERLSGGASRQTWLVHPTGAPDDAPVVLQIARPGALASSLPFDVEASLLRAARAVGVPVPPVLAAAGLDGAAPLGDRPWMLTGFVSGETIARRILRDEPFAGARDHLVADCGRALAAVHRIDATALTLRRADPVSEAAAILELIDEPHPVLELGLRWLEANRPDAASSAPAVVHGDFRLGNLIVDTDGLAAVIDWELAHVGDPLEDLGWFCVKAWRFGGPAPVAGLGSVQTLLQAYRDAGGAPVDEQALRWWTVAGTLRWGAICMVQSHTHLSGANRNVELAAIGRRVCQTELDLLELLGVATPTSVAAAVADAPQAAEYGADVHARPTAVELVEAVREYLDGSVRAATDGQVAFHARVAARVLAMVGRELTLGPAQATAHAARLAALGVRSEQELATAIRAGTVDAGSADVRTALLATTVDRLLVADPDHLETVEEQGGVG